MMDHAANAVPVTIVTGFLGSGKTTVLNQLLRLPSLADTAVIVNEFGAVGLDHLLVEQAIEDAVLLQNGCICCTVRGDIADTLELLWQRRENGTIPPFRRIAIETTGLADPAPVAHALLAEAPMRYACRLDGIITTVDALHGAAQLDRQPEARRQVAMADRILLTKTDLVSETASVAVSARMRALNAHAPVYHVINGAVGSADLFGLAPNEDTADTRLAAWLQPFAADPHHGHGHHPFRHQDDIGSVVLRHDRPIAWPALRLWLDSVLSLHGDAVLRLKGLVQLDGQERPIVLQGVHHVLHPPVFLARSATEHAATQIVLITRGLPAAGLRASFAQALGNLSLREALPGAGGA